jgi:hypothetical protein
MKAIWFGKSSSVSAWELKRVIGKFAPQVPIHLHLVLRVWLVGLAGAAFLRVGWVA